MESLWKWVRDEKQIVEIYNLFQEWQVSPNLTRRINHKYKNINFNLDMVCIIKST